MKLSEQLKYAGAAYDFLVELEHIDLAAYLKLVDILPPGLVAKLRITPDKGLIKRAAHLYEVCSLFLNYSRALIEEDYESESFEGLSEGYPEDCDLVMRGMVTGTIYFIDVTSSRNQELHKKKRGVLKSLADRYSITGSKTAFLIHTFDSYDYTCDISLIEEDNTAESVALKFVENIARSTTATRTAILLNCQRVYDGVLPKIASYDHVSHMYNKREPSSKLVDLAKKSISSNDAEDTIALFSAMRRKEHSPYISSLRRLANQYHSIKSLFRYPASRMARHDNLETALSSLESDLLAKTLLRAMGANGSVVLMRSNGTFVVSDRFPDSISDKKMLSIDSGFAIAAKHVRGHVFTIKFSYDEMDPNLRRILLKEAQPKARVDLRSESSVDKLMNTIISSESAVKHMASDMLKNNRNPTMSTVFDKIISMCDLAGRDLGNMGVVSSNILSKACAIIKRSLSGALISQRYEVANTFAASIKNSSKGSNYYVGINGPFDSVTITKMNSTQDSFKTRHYCVIGRALNIETTSELIKPTKVSRRGVFRSEFYNMNTNELVYDLKLPYTIMSLITWDIENNLKGGRLDELQLPDIITSCITHSAVNRDSFAQAAQQTRYFYMSSIGYGSNPSKISEKFNFFSPRYSWEFTYIVRMVKMGACLSILRDSDSIKDVLVDKEIPVVFPHSNFPAKSFNQSVSSMYFCNVFNKFRAFHEVASSICYNELDSENKIYENSIKLHRQELTGFSEETEKNIVNKDYLKSEGFVKNEIAFCDSILKKRPQRFSASCVFILAASNKFLTATDATVKDIYSELAKSPIDACTMRGSMDHHKSNEKGQSIRAASAILERLMVERGHDPDKINKNPSLAQQFVDELRTNDQDFSIMTSLIKQLTHPSVYRYRITDKDQVGTREISVLNAAFRIGALFYETIAKCLSSQIRDVDVLDDPSKEIKFEDAVKESVKISDKWVTFFDNSDQQRWGPNHMLHYFSVMMLGCLPDEPGLVKMLNKVSEKVLKKRAKFPEPLIKYFKTKRDRGTGSKEMLTSSGSAALNEFFLNHYEDLVAEEYDSNLRFGMCQGIFHGTSSALHGILVKVQEEAMLYSHGSSMSIKSFVTSDDASRITRCEQSKMKSIMSTQHSVIISSGNLMNILRNDSKSAANPHIAEFNSVFYKRGIMATPSIKQRISKIDAGSGDNHYEDYLTALSNSSNYFSAGGSYSGALILAILNLTIHTEQWNRWEFCNAKHFYKPVELGGFPVIEPFSTSICGALSNFYLRVSDRMDPETFSRMHVRNITSKPELVSLNDFVRNLQNKAVEAGTDLKIFKNSGPMGIISLLRTDKKLSMFERRCRMSLWTLPEEFTTLVKKTPSARKFLFNISRTADMTLHDVPEGVNSFYLRYTDPWVSELRSCHRVSENSSLIHLGFLPSSTISYKALKDKLLSLTVAESEDCLAEMSREIKSNLATEVLSKQLTVRFRDAKVLLNYVSNQECETFVQPKQFPSTTRLSLKETSETDRVQYTLSMVKYLAGSKSRGLITEYTKNVFAYDSLPSDYVGMEISLKDAVILSDNNMHVFEKYVKSYTKMVCAGRPADLTSVVTLILSNRFTESAGVKTVGSIRLAGDYLTTLNYTGWYRDLDARSRLSMSQNTRNVLTRSYADVVKFGVISNSSTINKFDNFQVTDSTSEHKSIMVDVKRKGEFRKAARNWCATDNDLILGNSSVSALVDGVLISRNEYCVSKIATSKMVYDKYLRVEINGKNAAHQIESVREGAATFYKHTFLTTESSYCIVNSVEVVDRYKGEKWLETLASALRKKYLFNSTTEITNDSLRIISMHPNKAMRATILPETMTIALVDNKNELVIPVCHTMSTSVDFIDLADPITHADVLLAAQAYKKLSDATVEFSRIIRSHEKFLKELLFKYSYYSSQNALNRLSREIFGTTHDNKFYDILRCMLISDSNLDVTISPSKLYNTINNACVESDSMSSFIVSVKVGDTTITDDALEPENCVRLGDLMDSPEFEDWADEVNDATADEEVASESDFSDDFNFDMMNEIEFDINFDDIEDDDDADDLVDLLNDLNKTSRQVDETTMISRSVRTNHSLNPVDEYPADILKFTHDWLASTKVKMRMGLNYNINSIIDVLRYYSTMVFSGQTEVSDVLMNFYGSSEFKPIMPLSVISAINLS